MQGFTKHEQIVLVVLLTGFVAGLVVRGIQVRQVPTRVEGPSVRTCPPPKEVVERDKGTAAGHRIDINRANEIELIQLPGIGPVTAKRIIEYRKQRGSFTTLESLKEVKGIGNKTLEKMKPFIMIEKQ